MRVVSFASAPVLAPVCLCMGLTLWGRAVLATGGSIFYVDILSIKQGVTISPGVRMYVCVRGMAPIYWVAVGG
eukprot:182294-Pelagomonas_calceolata.AAC.1